MCEGGLPKVMVLENTVLRLPSRGTGSSPISGRHGIGSQEKCKDPGTSVSLKSFSRTNSSPRDGAFSLVLRVTERESTDLSRAVAFRFAF